MQTFYIKIVHDETSNYNKVEVSGNTPCLLADEIKKTVTGFYHK